MFVLFIFLLEAVRGSVLYGLTCRSVTLQPAPRLAPQGPGLSVLVPLPREGWQEGGMPSHGARALNFL